MRKILQQRFVCVCHLINKQHKHNLQPHLILRGKETLWLYGKVAGSAETLNLDTNIWQKMGTEREPCESVQDIHYYTVHNTQRWILKNIKNTWRHVRRLSLPRLEVKFFPLLKNTSRHFWRDVKFCVALRNFALKNPLAFPPNIMSLIRVNNFFSQVLFTFFQTENHKRFRT